MSKWIKDIGMTETQAKKVLLERKKHKPRILKRKLEQKRRLGKWFSLNGTVGIFQYDMGHDHHA